jgi:hypothetical protein
MRKIYAPAVCGTFLALTNCSSTGNTYVRSVDAMCDALRLDSMPKPVYLRHDKIENTERTMVYAGPFVLVNLKYDKSLPISELFISGSQSKETGYSCKIVIDSYGRGQRNLCSETVSGQDIQFEASFPKDDASLPGKYMGQLSEYVTNDVLCRSN